MTELLILSQDAQAMEPLCQGLTVAGYSCRIVASAGEMPDDAAPALVLVESNGSSPVKQLAGAVRRDRDTPVIVLLHRETADSVDVDSASDFVLEPWDIKELDLRIKRQLRQAGGPAGEVIKCGDLVIDVSRYEIYVSGRPVALTFKEYELLKFLAGHPDRVFSREALLNKVWGYDYYGGDRTVDVHIQRLRSKIEGSSHIAIETVRNIGYRLKVD